MQELTTPIAYPYEVTNISYLEEIALGDKGFKTDMIRLFLEHTPKYIKDMKKAVISDDLKGISSMAHKLKSSLTYFGLDQLSGPLNELEQLERVSIPKSKIVAQFLLIKNVYRAAHWELKIKLKSLE